MSIKGIFTKVIIVLLACVLIFMGIGDIISGNDKEKVVAKVGREVISLNEYKSFYQDRVDYIRKIVDSEMSKEQISSLKYELLDSLIEQKLLINLVNELNLDIGEEAVKKYTRNISYFQNDKGEFDKDKFFKSLKSLGLKEEDYVLKLKKTLPILMLMTSLFKENYPITLSQKVDKDIYKYRHQTRTVDVLTTSQDRITNIPIPDDQVLSDFYEKNKSNFYYPEYRSAKYLNVNLEDFTNQAEVSDEEISAIIEKQELKDQRDILNVVFVNKEKAEKAILALKKGELTFEQVVHSTGKTLADIKSDNITKNALPEAMREQVFSLKEGEISEVLTSSFGWHIIKLERMHQVNDEDLLNLQKDIRAFLKAQKTYNIFNEFIQRTNHAIHSGSSMEEIAALHNLEIKIVGPVDQNKKDKDGKEQNFSESLISLIFSKNKSQKGYFTDVDGSAFSVEVTDIIFAKQKTFEESKPEVLEMWNKDCIEKEMFKVASKILHELNSGIDIEKIQDIKLLDQVIMHRDKTKNKYPDSFTEAVFNLKEVNSITNPVKHDNTFIIGILKNITEPSGIIDPYENGKQVMHSLQEELMMHLKLKYKIEVNHSLIENLH